MQGLRRSSSSEQDCSSVLELLVVQEEDLDNMNGHADTSHIGGQGGSLLGLPGDMADDVADASSVESSASLLWQLLKKTRRFCILL